MTDTPKKVLVVEDEKPLAKALEIKLGKSGFKTASVFNGEDALKLLETEKYDLVLLDLLMPRVGGFDVLSTLKQKGIVVKVIVLSNLGQEEDITKAKELGAVDFIVKSDAALSEIVTRVASALK
jgi:DNA-binding response OmpR family regulator